METAVTSHENNKQAYSKVTMLTRNTTCASPGPRQKFSFNLRVRVNASDSVRKALHSKCPSVVLACLQRRVLRVTNN